MTDDLVRAYVEHLKREPQGTASTAPPTEQEVMAREYLDWQGQARAYRVLLAPRLLKEAVERLADAPEDTPDEEETDG